MKALVMNCSPKRLSKRKVRLWSFVIKCKQILREEILL